MSSTWQNFHDARFWSTLWSSQFSKPNLPRLLGCQKWLVFLSVVSCSGAGERNYRAVEGMRARSASAGSRQAGAGRSVRALRKLASKLNVFAQWLETGEPDPDEELALLVLGHKDKPLPPRALKLARRLLKHKAA